LLETKFFAVRSASYSVIPYEVRFRNNSNCVPFIEFHSGFFNVSRLFESGWSLRLAGEFIFVVVRPFVLALSRLDDRYALGGQAAPNFLCCGYDE